MNSFAKNVLGTAVGVALIMGSFWALGSQITQYLDRNFGEGTAGVVLIFFSGAVFLLLAVAVIMFLTNRTHEAAGADITDFNSSNIKTTVAMLKILENLQRSTFEPKLLEAKAQLEDRKAGARVWAVQEAEAVKARARREAWEERLEREAYEKAKREQREQVEREEMGEYWYGSHGSDVLVE